MYHNYRDFILFYTLSYKLITINEIRLLMFDYYDIVNFFLSR